MVLPFEGHSPNLSTYTYVYNNRQTFNDSNMRQLKITKQVTNRETASLDKYLQEIGRLDHITVEGEAE